MTTPRIKVRMLRGNLAGYRADAILTPVADVARDWIARGWCERVEEQKTPPRPKRLAAIVLLAFVLSPWAVARERFELAASAARTATGNSAAFEINTTRLMLGVDVTAASGTSPQLDLWLQGSDDGGTTWYDLVCDQVLKTAGSAAVSGTVALNVRDVVDAKVSTAAESFMGLYSDLATDTVRVRWVISGATPSFTFRVASTVK